jgi:hypothetical protein
VLWGTCAGALLWHVAPANAAVQLRVDPVFTMRAAVGVQAIRARVSGLAPRRSVIIAAQTASAEYDRAAKADGGGYLSVDMPMVWGDAASGGSRASVAVLGRGRVIAASRLPDILEPDVDIVLLLGPNSSNLGYLTSGGGDGAGTLQGKAVSASELPDRWFGYGPVAAVVTDVDTLSSLDRARRQALIDWLESGGLLVTYPGSSGAVPKQPEFASAAPLSKASGKPREASLMPLGKAIGQPRALGAQLAWPATVVSGSRVIGPASRPLAAAAQAGLGVWVALTVDPTQDELAVSPSRQAVFRGLFAWAFPGRPGPVAALSRQVPPESTPVGRMPNGWSLALLGALYVVLVGPANFFILGRMDRRDLAWATVPAMSVVFAAAMLGVGLSSRGGPLQAYQTETIVWGRGAREGVAHATVSLFSPRSARYSALLTGDWVPLAPPGDPRFEQGPLFKARLSGGGADVRELLIPRWSVRRFVATGIARTGAPLEVELKVTGGRATGAVRAVTDKTSDVWLVQTDPGFVIPLGTLAPNQVREVDVSASDAARPADGRGLWERKAIAAMMTGRPLRDIAGGGLVVIGVPEKPAPVAKVEGAHDSVAVVWAIPVLDRQGGPLRLPAASRAPASGGGNL